LTPQPNRPSFSASRRATTRVTDRPRRCAGCRTSCRRRRHRHKRRRRNRRLQPTWPAGSRRTNKANRRRVPRGRWAGAREFLECWSGWVVSKVITCMFSCFFNENFEVHHLFSFSLINMEIHLFIKFY